jgi:hypothetical protein
VTVPSVAGVGSCRREPSRNDLGEIVAHEDPRGRFIAISDARSMVDRNPIDAAITKAYLEARGLDWR